MTGPTHFRATVLARSQGRHAVAAAAYRSGSRLQSETAHVYSDQRAPLDAAERRETISKALAELSAIPEDRKEERRALALAVKKARYQSGTVELDKDGRATFDYRHKDEVFHSEIVAPKNAPEWATDRGRLWNEVERVETRKNAQLARDFVIALPRSMTLEQGRDLVRDYVRETFVKRGMVADFAIHESMASDGKPNPHAHVMLTMREIGRDGFHEKKATPLARSWNHPGNMDKWRSAWQEMGNARLEALGSDERIELRSYAARGIDKQGTKHLGASADKMEKKGKRTKAGDVNREIEAENMRRASEGETIAPALAAGAGRDTLRTVAERILAGLQESESSGGTGSAMRSRPADDVKQSSPMQKIQASQFSAATLQEIRDTSAVMNQAGMIAAGSPQEIGRAALTPMNKAAPVQGAERGRSLGASRSAPDMRSVSRSTARQDNAPRLSATPAPKASESASQRPALDAIEATPQRPAPTPTPQTHTAGERLAHAQGRSANPNAPDFSSPTEGRELRIFAQAVNARLTEKANQAIRQPKAMHEWANTQAKDVGVSKFSMRDFVMPAIDRMKGSKGKEQERGHGQDSHIQAERGQHEQISREH